MIVRRDLAIDKSKPFAHAQDRHNISVKIDRATHNCRGVRKRCRIHGANDTLHLGKMQSVSPIIQSEYKKLHATVHQTLPFNQTHRFDLVIRELISSFRVNFGRPLCLSRRGRRINSVHLSGWIFRVFIDSHGISLAREKIER